MQRLKEFTVYMSLVIETNVVYFRCKRKTAFSIKDTITRSINRNKSVILRELGDVFQLSATG